MKKLLKQSARQLDEAYGENSKVKTETDLTYLDLVNVLEQLEELKKFNIAVKTDDGILKLIVGDSVYEIKKAKDQYPQVRLHKLDA